MRRNKKLCIGFIERILGVKVRDIAYVGTQETMEFSRTHRGIRLDVYVEDDADTVYDLEMQTTADPALAKRSRYYHGLIDLSQTEKGIPYRNLRKSYVVFICTRDPFGFGKSVYHFVKQCIGRPELILGDGTETVFTNAAGSRKGMDRELAALLDYIAGIGASDAFTEELDQKVGEVIADKGWRAEYMTYEMKLQERWEDGRTEGKTENEMLNNQLFSYLLSHGLSEEALKATKDEAYKKELITQYCGTSAEAQTSPA